VKIALISPRASFLSRHPEFNKFWTHSKTLTVYRLLWSGMGTGLLVVAALTPASCDIDLIDENHQAIDFSKDYDLVGITGMTQQAPRAYEIADQFRERNIPVVLGGIHATILPDEAKQHADSIVVGEAEYVWPELLNDFRKGGLRPYYRSQKTVDLMDSPVPRYDLLKGKNYKAIYIQSTRGCPHDCEFCCASNVFGRKYRKKSIAQVMNELTEIKEKFGNIRITFADDNHLVNRQYSKELIKEMTSLNIRWGTTTDISIAQDEKFLDLLRKSGCTFLFIGLEALTEKGLKQIDEWKYRHLKNYADYVKRIQSHGIGVMASFMIGLDTDDASSFDGIIQFVEENNVYNSHVCISTPFPGTRLRERLAKENRLLPTDWRNYTTFDVNFVHPTLSLEDLENGLLTIYKSINSEVLYSRRMEYFMKIQKDLIRKEMGKDGRTTKNSK